MSTDLPEKPWDFESAIKLFTFSTPPAAAKDTNSIGDVTPRRAKVEEHDDALLGDFSSLWEYLGTADTPKAGQDQDVFKYKVNGQTVARVSAAHLAKAVKWRDEVDGADLEDNDEPTQPSTASLRTQKRAARRARARGRAALVDRSGVGAQSDTATDAESTDELNALRRSPDRRSLIANIIGRPRPKVIDGSPPTSPSPPKREPPISKPFLWSTVPTPPHSSSHRVTITPRDGFTTSQRKAHLIDKLIRAFPSEKTYLRNAGIIEPAFTPLNVSPRGIHVFVDISNIYIGLHECLKKSRNLPKETRVRRVPLEFHNLSLVLERGRPAAKRVLAGSDRTPAITQAMNLGYETNMLERVHKVKTPKSAPHKANHHKSNNNSSNNKTNISATSYFSSVGETSGSETNTGYHSSSTPLPQSKWVEQGVDEILHLKMMESLIDTDAPSTIVLATGDAAEAEYSDGFLAMITRALKRGWSVEVVSFGDNAARVYQSPNFVGKWRGMFRWVGLDAMVEELVAEPEKDGYDF